MKGVRTDLAVEARELWNETAEKTDCIPGVDAFDETINGFNVTTVKILNENGERELNKPVGTYITLETDPYINREEDSFDRACLTLSELLKRIFNIGDNDTVLVAGLGNADITPDIIGPDAVKHTMITRHLVNYMPNQFDFLRPVAAIVPGVLASTGIESADLIRSACDKVQAKMVIVIDALASRRFSRVCRTVQISDTGIIPGSGVGNSRAAIDKNFLGVPVISVGVPTVVDAGTLAYDLVSQAGANAFEPEDFKSYGGDMIVTPRDIDRCTGDMAKLLGYGINLALHKDLTVEDITMFLS